jgi:hypothetical protein
MRRTQLASFVFLASVVPVAAVASPARPFLSVDVGPAVAIDGRVGAGGDARGAYEVPLSGRVSLGFGVEAGAAAWSDIGDARSGDLVGASVFGQLHVAIHLTPSLRFEPAIGGGVIHSRGDTVRGTLPAYSSTVALVQNNLRVGVSSRVCIGDLEGTEPVTFSPDTQLSLFVGWQS